MRLSDISLDWTLSGAVGLSVLAAAGAVIVRYRKGTKAKSAEPVDSWERSEERRRQKELLYGTASYVLLFVIAAVYAILRPNDTTVLANWLGVARGTDLLQYALVIAFIILFV